MTPQERKSAISLALLMSFRMLGLFMILPVFAIYAAHLHNVTPKLIGIALGVYGLTQACLQIPFGMLSDKFGRKPIIFIGLLIFAVGSVIAALAHTIDGVILGRALQGGGAVGSVIIALLADLTADEHRTKAMAIIGMTIGVSFAIAMVAGPALSGLVGVQGIFWLTAILALIGIVILFTLVPTPTNNRLHRDAEPVPALFKQVLRNSELLRLDFGIFIQHAVLTATFIAVPIALTHFAKLDVAHQWMLYLPVLLVAFVIMVPFIIIAEKKRKMKAVFVGSIAVILISQLWLWWQHTSIFAFAVGLLLFFTAFTILEASLPSLVSKLAPAGSKGTAMGVYSTSQFFGIFIGGLVGGWAYGRYGIDVTFIVCAIGMLLWLIVALTMKKPAHVASKMLPLGSFTEQDPIVLQQELLQRAGVKEVFISPEEQTIYLKVDSREYVES